MMTTMEFPTGKVKGLGSNFDMGKNDFHTIILHAMSYSSYGLFAEIVLRSQRNLIELTDDDDDGDGVPDIKETGGELP